MGQKAEYQMNSWIRFICTPCWIEVGVRDMAPGENINFEKKCPLSLSSFYYKL